MTRRKTRAVKPATPRSREGSFARGSRIAPRTSPAFPRPRSARKRHRGFSLATKVRVALLSSTLALVLGFRLLGAPAQAWVEANGAAGRFALLGVLLAPAALVLAWHRWTAFRDRD